MTTSGIQRIIVSAYVILTGGLTAGAQDSDVKTEIRELRALVEKLQLRRPSLPVLANASGEAMRSVAALRQELSQHLLRPVDWARTMVSLESMKVKTVVELGPGRVLASLAAKHIPGVDTWNADELLIDFA